MQTRLSPVYQTKFSAGDSVAGEFTGYGSVYDQLDSYGDRVQRGAFSKSLDQHKASGTQPALLWSHDPTEPIGVWTNMVEDGRGLRVEGKLTLGTRRGAEAHALMKDGAIGLSIGFRLVDSERTRDGRLLKEVDLVETSLVALPANPAAKVINVKSAVPPSDIRTFEAGLRDALGFSAREAKRIASGGWRAFEGRDDRSDELDEVVAALRAAAKSLSHF